MGFENLKEKTKVSSTENYKSFRAAAETVAQLKFPTTLQTKSDLLNEIDKAYSLISDNLITAQTSNRLRRLADYRKKVTEAAAALAYYAVLFHLAYETPEGYANAFPSGVSERRKARFQKCLRQMTVLFKHKNKDYGNSFRFWGIPGLLVRLGDKIFRLRQLTTRGYKQKVKDERIPDTALDLANYSLMLLMLLSENRSLKLGE